MAVYRSLSSPKQQTNEPISASRPGLRVLQYLEISVDNADFSRWIVSHDCSHERTNDPC